MSQQPIKYPDYRAPLTVLTSLFFIWGFMTCLNDILIPHLKALFTLSYTQAMLIQFCFFAAYFVMSMPSGWLVERIGYQRGIVTGLATAACGCLLFYPAAGAQSYPLFLTGFFVLASGITLLQVAANPYVSVLGRAETASSRLTLTQAFNSLGTTLAPYLGSVLILSVGVKTADELRMLDNVALASYRAEQAAAVQMPYLALAATLLVLAGVFSLINLPTITGESTATQSPVQSRKVSAWQFPHLVLGAAAIFVYVGGEVAIGSFLVNFLALPDIANLPEHEAGKYVSLYWGGAMIGRFIGSAVMQKVVPHRVLAFHAVTAMALVGITVLSDGSLAMWALLAVGLCNSIMFPTIFSMAIRDLGAHTGQGSGILCSAIVGGAVVPLLQGLFADFIGLQQALLVPALCYALITGYALVYPRLIARTRFS